MAQINVLLADDHMMVREGIHQLLELEDNINVIGEVGDGIECIDAIYKLRPDVVVLDINMPKMDGLSVLKKIRETNISCKIIVLTFYNEIGIVQDAVRSGANGYILKEADSTLLVKAINIVTSGERYIQPSIAAMLRQSKIIEQQNRVEALTRRELEIIKLLVGGLYNKEIADTLNISEKTVKNHISSIFRKINVSDRTQAAVYAIKNNLVEI
ncbi:MAG TPA: DNA-binding response regulator [Lachnospiraceae bacterium]|nr:response regulator transcription factor [uncultured Lachnoclostridium sp.]HAU84887.1 DNA-binding response regulator [Lachnospiraceae bacterium]